MCIRDSFGIKCGGNWRGRTVMHDDDARNECFRAYRNPKDSYEDLSLIHIFYSSFIYGSFCKVIQKEESVYDW